MEERQVEVWYKPKPDAEPVYWDTVPDDAASIWAARCGIEAALGQRDFVFGVIDPN